MRKLVAAPVALLIGLVVLTPAEASHAAHRHRVDGQLEIRATRVSHTAPVHTAPVYHVYYTNDATEAISEAAARWGVDFNWLLRVATCESGLNPNAYNPSGASGLFQFMPGTYWTYAAQIGETRSYFNPYGAANVAAYMFHLGLAYEWTCR